MALAAWLKVLDDQRGRIFRRVLPGGTAGEALSPETVRQIVKRRCALAGLQMEDFSAHSLCSGSHRGEPARCALEDRHGHVRPRVGCNRMGYMRAGELASELAARLLK